MSSERALAQDLTNCERQRPQFGLKMLVESVTIAAVVFAISRFATLPATLVLGVYGLTWIFGCWATRRAVLCILPCLYVPFAWIFVRPELSASVFSLRAAYPTLPGFWLSVAVYDDINAIQWVAGFLTTGAFLTLVWNAREKNDLIGAMLLTLTLGSMMSLLAASTLGN